MNDFQDSARDTGGVLLSRGDRGLARRLQRLAVQGVLQRFAPGIYLVTGVRDDPMPRIIAGSCWAPGAVLTGAAAARLSFWPSIAVGTVTLSGSIARTDVTGLRLVREHVPGSLITTVPGPHGLLPLTVPALTALDLGADGIDQALLTRAATLAELHRALELTPNRPGNLARRRLLRDSRDEPWSAAERLGHADCSPDDVANLTMVSNPGP